MTDDDPRIGTRLCDRYEIRRVVADGGMGRVYEGIDKQNDTRVAVKVLHDDVAKDEVSLERFKREYEISSQLPHDHIVKVTRLPARRSGKGVAARDGVPRRRGAPRRPQAREVPPPERIVRMLSQVAHRARRSARAPVRPPRSEAGQPLPVRHARGRRRQDPRLRIVKDKNKDAKKLTVLGTTIGSPYYMAPEQAQGLETLDARADVFALAAIAYECMHRRRCRSPATTGRRSCSRSSRRIRTRRASRRRRRSIQLPPTMDDVMEEALAKNPNIRTKTRRRARGRGRRARTGSTGDHKQWAKTPQAELATASRRREVARDGAEAAVARVRGRSVRVDPCAIRSRRSKAAAAVGPAAAAVLTRDGSGVRERERAAIRHGARGCSGQAARVGDPRRHRRRPRLLLGIIAMTRDLVRARVDGYFFSRRF